MDESKYSYRKPNFSYLIEENSLDGILVNFFPDKGYFINNKSQQLSTNLKDKRMKKTLFQYFSKIQRKKEHNQFLNHNINTSKISSDQIFPSRKSVPSNPFLNKFEKNKIKMLLSSKNHESYSKNISILLNSKERNLSKSIQTDKSPFKNPFIKIDQFDIKKVSILNDEIKRFNFPKRFLRLPLINHEKATNYSKSSIYFNLFLPKDQAFLLRLLKKNQQQYFNMN